MASRYLEDLKGGELGFINLAPVFILMHVGLGTLRVNAVDEDCPAIPC